MNVCIIYGGKSGEHQVSKVSALSVFKNLDKFENAELYAALVALAHSLAPGGLDCVRLCALDTPPIERHRAAIAHLERLGVSALVDPEDMVLDPPDWHCVSLYLAEIMKWDQERTPADRANAGSFFIPFPPSPLILPRV